MVTDLVEIKNNQVVVSSRQVAENFGKRHTHILDSIKSLINSAEISVKWFKTIVYKDSTGKQYPIYLTK